MNNFSLGLQDDLYSSVAKAMRDYSQPIESRLDRLLSVLERHQEGWNKYAPHIELPLAAGLAVGATALAHTSFNPTLWAKTLIIDNESGYRLQETRTGRVIPPFSYNYMVHCFPATNSMAFKVLAGESAVVGHLTVIATEAIFQGSGPITDEGSSAAGTSGVRIPITSPATTNNGTNTVIPLAEQASQFTIQNNTGGPIQYDLDTPATSGSMVLPNGQSADGEGLQILSSIDILAPGVFNINGTAASNIVIWAWT